MKEIFSVISFPFFQKVVKTPDSEPAVLAVEFY